MVDVRILTEDGESLQGDLFEPDAEPSAAVVITHPHPQMGGDMYTPVPAAFFDACRTLGVAALRFNFRGTGSSTGVHDKGGNERLDVAAAVDRLATTAPGVRLLLAGWSFGADVSLTLDDPAIGGWFLAAPPLGVVDPVEMAASAVEAPKVLAIGSADQFNPPAKAQATTADWTNTTVLTIAGADHFFGPHLPTLVDHFRQFVAATADA